MNVAVKTNGVTVEDFGGGAQVSIEFAHYFIGDPVDDAIADALRDVERDVNRALDDSGIHGASSICEEVMLDRHPEQWIHEDDYEEKVERRTREALTEAMRLVHEDKHDNFHVSFCVYCNDIIDRAMHNLR